MLTKRIQSFLLGLAPALNDITLFTLDKDDGMRCGVTRGRGSSLINTKESKLRIHAMDGAMEIPTLLMEDISFSLDPGIPQYILSLKGVKAIALSKIATKEILSALKSHLF